MAFADGTLVALQTANSDAGKVWLYKEAATLAAIRAANYFNDAADTWGMGGGDLLIIIGSDGFGLNLTILTGVNVTMGEALTSA